MKFDAIVGNPPYQETHDTGGRKDQASNLWSKFWSRAFDLCEDDGVIAYITPTSWLSPSADLKKDDMRFGKDRLWEIFDSYTSYADVTGVADHFPGVGSSFGYVIVDRSGNGGLRFSDGANTTLGFLPRSGVERVMAELSLTDNLGDHFKIDQANHPRLRVSVPMSRSLLPESIEVLEGSDVKPSMGSDRAALYLYVYVDSKDQALQVRDRIVCCLDILNEHCRWAGFINIRALKMISYVEPRT